MKKTALKFLCLLGALTFVLAFSGCDAIKNLSNKIPEKFTDGIKYDRDFPDDVIEIYDDAIVFESMNVFDELVIIMGTEDDIDDVIDFYRDFFEDNEITIAEESEEKDEYYARFVFDGYEFKIKAKEPDGEYIEDLFEFIIYISAKEVSESQLNAPEQTGQTSAEPTQAPTPTATAAPTPEPTPAAAYPGETPLAYLRPGSYELAGMEIDGQLQNTEMTIYFAGDGTGTLYSYEYDIDERYFFDFTYDFSDSVLTLYAEGDSVSYEAYFDDGILHLANTGFGIDMYLTDWSEANGVSFSDYEFTAYGNWMYYEPDTGYVETISFWPGGTGYVYNWGGTYENRFMYWTFENGIFNISDDKGESYSYGISHRGEVFELHQLNGSDFFYNRISGSYWLCGTYYLEDITDAGVEEWTITFYYDGTCEYTINGISYTSGWYIDTVTGRIEFALADTYYAFDYHYSAEGLYLFHKESGAFYDFAAVG